MNEVLRLDNIVKKYPGITVLDGLTLALRAGESVALVAPSGAGKSTLLHIAGLLDLPDSGRVVLNGQDMTGAPDRSRTEARGRDLGFVYQFHHLLPEFSAQENIILPQLAQGVSRTSAQARAVELLKQVSLDHRADHRPAELSGGEQQRVAFCRALANKPALLIADEPTGNLDPATSEKVFSLLLLLVKETGLGALIATHDHSLAARMDRIIHLDMAVG